MLLFFHFLHSNVQDNNFQKQKCRVLFFIQITLVNHVLPCARANARIKWITLGHKNSLEGE